MLTYLNNCEDAIIVVHEIYGINQHIKDTCQRLSDYGFDILCPSLLKVNSHYDYDQEALAYNNFINNIGFPSAVSQIKHLIHKVKRRYKHLFILGYSVGATAAWICSDDENLCDGVIGYYGSRIRDYLELNPKCPSMLFFPSQEKSFNVSELIKALNKKDRVKAIRFNAEHGFSDQYSKKFCQESYNKSFKEMIEFIEKNDPR